jgi:ketosteroid isomerase-like protein
MTGNAPAMELMRELYAPLDRGETPDDQAFFDALADDVVLKLSVGEARGKQAVVDYFTNVDATMEVRPFDAPLEYYGAGDRVVILGDETITVKRTGATHQAEWAWVVDVHDGLISRILDIQDLSGVADEVRKALPH